MIDTRIRPPAAALTRRLAARAARMAVDAVNARRSAALSRDPRGLWPDMFEE
ncbi:hypothetical protein ACFCW2_06255 [Qipengyuania sp. DSG2-2]|uniref:hypothetical protein n=1 Tax=Qipengyuania sp. DGS2-2 TaxID=3349631 RepID=UPI0036D3CC37